MRVSIVASVLSAVVAFAPAVSAHEPPAGATTPAAAVRHPLLAWHPVAWRPPAIAAATSPIAAGLRAEIDPATGEFVTPDPAHFPLESRVGVAREAGLTLVTRPDGSRSVRVADRLRKWSVASIGPDGTLRQDCVPTEAAAIARARAAAAANTKGER